MISSPETTLLVGAANLVSLLELYLDLGSCSFFLLSCVGVD